MPVPGEECPACGLLRFAHSAGCARTPRLTRVPGSAAVEWWVHVEHERVGLVTSSGPRGHRAYVARRERDGARVPPSRRGPCWSRAVAVNALIRDAAEHARMAGLAIVDLDGLRYDERGRGW